jgi:hypothetical protein
VLVVVCRSLGLVLLECLTGRYPFDASGGPMDLIIHVSSFDTNALHCAKGPRPESAGAH